MTFLPEGLRPAACAPRSHTPRFLGALVAPAISVLILVVACGAPAGAPDAGADAGRAVECGPTTCERGQICCNESCGICVAPGGTCTEQACTDGGPAPDAGADAGRDAAIACGSATCAPGEVCCTACDGTRSCGAACTGPPCSAICSATQPCEAGEYCEATEASCGEGSCKPRPAGCPDDCPGVCGCDGSDYCNECDARANGTDVAREGSCDPSCEAMDARGEGVCSSGPLGFAYDGGRCVGIHCTCVGTECDALYPSSDACEDAYASCIFSFCGGFIGATCSDTEFCDYPDDAFCGAADGSGLCRRRPSDCTGESDAPVCGCDGTSYDNECQAHLAGTDAASRGRCEVPDDCRTTGCPSGSACTACFVGWICLEDGMFCAF